MPEDSQAGHVEVKSSTKVDMSVDGDGKHILTNGESNILQKEEDAASDHEFIQESTNAKETSGLLKQILEAEKNSGSVNANLLEIKKVKELEHQLETSMREQKHSESEKDLLKSEIVLADQKLEKMNRYCEELELERKVMRDEMLGAENKYNLLHRSLQEELTEKDIKHKEFLEVKEAFAALTFELESLRKKMKELEEELAESSNEMHKLEEQSKNSSSKVELESKRALEFEKMLELAQYKEKEMEDHMDNLQKELKVLYDKIAENRHVEEIHTNSLEISAIQEKLEMSRSTVVELERKLVSKDSIIHDLTQELSLHKASEEQMKANVVELDSQLSASKEELQAKIMKLEEIELKLEELEEDKERITSSKNQLLWHKMTLQSLQKDLSDLTREKVTLQSTVGELNLKLSKSEDLRRQLEAKLKLADQNFNVTESLLSQALSHNKELEQKQKSLEHETKKLTDTASKRNIELEDLVQASKLAEGGIKKKLRESEMRLSSAEKHNTDLKQQVSRTEIRCLEAESEVEELNNQVKQLTTLLRKIDEENSLSRRRFQGYENKIGQLESSLNRSFRRNTELEKELNNLLGKSTENESANTTNQHSLPLEDNVQSYHLKSENAPKVVDELELSLETDDSHIQQLEQLLTRTEAKCRYAEAESKQYSSKISALYAEIEAHQARSTSLEAVLRAATEKERELTDELNATIKERQYVEDSSNILAKNLAEASNLIHELQKKLKFLEGKIESTEEELKDSSLREKELVEKLRYAVDELKNQGRVIDEVTARNNELKSQNESLLKDSEFKIQEASLEFNLKESEIKELHEKLKFLEEQKALCTDHAVEATENVASLKAELEANALKLVSFRNTVEELNQKVSESHLKAEQLFLENETMAQTNSKLRMDLEAHQLKHDELNQLLNFNDAEMEANTAQLASHLETIAKLADENSRYLEVLSSSESRLKETEVQLHETIEKLKQKSCEVEDLNEKVLSLETQLRNNEEQASESAAIISCQKNRLADTLLRLDNLEAFIKQLQRNFDESKTVNEDLTRENLCLSQELSIYTDKMKELQNEFDIFVAEKEVISIQLHSFKKETEVLKQQLNSDMEKHQLQITTAMEEHDKLTEMYQKARKELEEIVIHFEEQINQQKHREVSLIALVENLKAELADKALMQDQISEIEHKLLISQKSNMEVIKSMQTAIEKEAILTSKLKEHTSLIEERDTLVEELKKAQKELDLAQRTIEEQKEWESRREKERKASMKQSLAKLETKYKRRTVLEKQVEELMQKLKQAEPQYIEKVREESKKPAYISMELTELKQRHGQTAEYEKKIAEIEKKLKLVNAALEEEVQKLTTETEPSDEKDIESRNLELETTMILCGSKKESDYENQTLKTTSLHLTTQVYEDPSGAMALKFILGVALVSMIIGIILGKRY